jgi:hypothetical protein
MNFLFLLLVFLLTVNPNAFSKLIEESYLVQNIEILDLVKNRSELTIDHVAKDHFEIYGPKGLGSYLKRIGANPISMQLQTKTARAEYPTPEVIAEQIQALAAKYPETQSKTIADLNLNMSRTCTVMKLSVVNLWLGLLQIY